MLLAAQILCWLACFDHVAGCPVLPSADRAASVPLPQVAAFHPSRAESPACTIGTAGRGTHAGRTSDDAADLEDESDDDSSDDISLLGPVSACVTDRPSLTRNGSVTPPGLRSTHRSAVLRC
jgi:hypothetical protein